MPVQRVPRIRLDICRESLRFRERRGAGGGDGWDGWVAGGVAVAAAVG